MMSHGFPNRSRERELCYAAFYALYLRQVEGYSPDEAAVLVKQRYPGVRIPELRKPSEHAHDPRSAVA